MNDKHHQQQKTVKLPKGVGISPKLFFSVIIGLAVMLMIVLILIFSYRGNKHKPELETQNSLVKQQSGISVETAIAQLNQSVTEGVLVKQKPTKVQNDPSQPVSTPVKTTYPDQQVTQAARSQISLMNNFHGPSNQSDLAGSNSDQLNSLANQENPLNSAAQNALSNLGNSRGERYQSQNMQSQKTAFLKANQNANHKFYLDSTLTKPVSPYEVKAGTIIPATLLTGIDSDLPDQITAQVSQNVYDTVTGNYLLIPQGTRVIGAYDSQVAYGQSRVLIAWSRLIFPNGDSFDLQGQPGADLLGMAGLHDLVNNHYVRIFGSALAFSLFGALGQLSQPKQAANAYPSNAQIIYGAIGQNLTQAGIQMTEKNMNIQPTITIRPGANFNILLTRDMVLPGSYRLTMQENIPQPTDTAYGTVK